MDKKPPPENRRDRLEMASEAGYSRLSFGSVIAGALVAYGAFAVLAAIAGGVLNIFGVDTVALTNNDWRRLGMAGGGAVVVSLLLAYLFGGYVAGRMARRAGASHGILVFVVGIVVAAGIGALVSLQADGDAIAANLRSLGMPTTGDDWRSIGTVVGLAALAAMLLGAVAGGILGERWHGKLLARALDPSVGPPRMRPVAGELAPVDGRPGGIHFAGPAGGSDGDAAGDDVVTSGPPSAGADGMSSSVGAVSAIGAVSAKGPAAAAATTSRTDEPEVSGSAASPPASDPGSDEGGSRIVH